ncbi:hypothetical protein SERLA73DRAFT_188310 [Serpula lacrymans var. lacrymans S7.3]|uniref:Uncharacterized protein n=2 Tax=Serpula lacrymans var. lacrymans TaxID=341189 RepID=F8QB35_SERL3|nr:uncharacterized protein SERLADRAFT_478379 [Serpula lacrymans var. lacrymans S7.9]EGN94421.1 hypothetical protein SERLA73DRAFT_188310 [Serpula lacrymans var. lacrymans S7.3]EGO19903.1 hypothetical protein SERLADRAFT_478379 [Serpula lacrymans var. lacrymans S7.9]
MSGPIQVHYYQFDLNKLGIYQWSYRMKGLVHRMNGKCCTLRLHEAHASMQIPMPKLPCSYWMTHRIKNWVSGAQNTTSSKASPPTKYQYQYSRIRLSLKLKWYRR